MPRSDAGPAPSLVPSTYPDGCVRFEDGRLCFGRLSSPLDLREKVEARNEALIAVAFGQRLDAQALDTLRKAARLSRSGDQGLAHLHLDLARLTRIPESRTLDARQTRARRLLDTGLLSDILLAKSSSLDSVEAFLFKYDADHPRVSHGGSRLRRDIAAGPSASAFPPTQRCVKDGMVTESRFRVAWSCLANGTTRTAIELRYRRITTSIGAFRLTVMRPSRVVGVARTRKVEAAFAEIYDRQTEDGKARLLAFCHLLDFAAPLAVNFEIAPAGGMVLTVEAHCDPV